MLSKEHSVKDGSYEAPLCAFSVVPCYFSLSGSKCCPQHHILKHLNMNMNMMLGSDSIVAEDSCLLACCGMWPGK
jgi:hypothetical protein